MIKLHYLEYRCHCLVIKALPITYVVQLFRVLIGLMSNLFDVFEIAQMLSSQALELFVKQLLQLTNFFEIPVEVLPEFLLSFGHIEDLIWNLFGFLFELLTLSSGHLLVYLDDLISHLGKYSFHVGDLRICQQVYCVLLLCEDIFLVLIFGLFKHVRQIVVYLHFCVCNFFLILFSEIKTFKSFHFCIENAYGSHILVLSFLQFFKLIDSDTLLDLFL